MRAINGVTPIVYVAAICALVCPAAGFAQQVTGALTNPVTVQAKSATLDDVFIEVAKSAGVNVIVDATHVSDQRITADFKGSLLELLLFRLCPENKLSFLQVEDRTFLFWTLPDLNALVDEVRQGATLEKLPEPPDGGTLSIMVKTYLQSIGVTLEKAPGLQWSTPLTRIPLPLQDSLIAYAQSSVLNPHAVGLSKDVKDRMPKLPTVFDDDFWTNTRVWVKNEHDAGRTIRLFRFGFEQLPPLQGGSKRGWEF